jgi:hypothetical protein
MGEVVETAVDQLIRLLEQKNEPIPMAEAAKVLNVPMKTLESWVEFLVEENILGIEYKFTKPFIYLNKPKKEEKKKPVMAEEEKPKIDKFKEEFHKKAIMSKIPKEKISFLWRNHMLNHVNKKRDYFFMIARNKGFTNIEPLWNKYLERIQNM